MSKTPKGFRPYSEFKELDIATMQQRARAFADRMRLRRSIRDFSDRAVPREIIERCIEAASLAPSGANLQPWHFVAVADAQVKAEIRVAAEGGRGASRTTR